MKRRLVIKILVDFVEERRSNESLGEGRRGLLVCYYFSIIFLDIGSYKDTIMFLVIHWAIKLWVVQIYLCMKYFKSTKYGYKCFRNFPHSHYCELIGYSLLQYILPYMPGHLTQHGRVNWPGYHWQFVPEGGLYQGVQLVSKKVLTQYGTQHINSQ